MSEPQLRLTLKFEIPDDDTRGTTTIILDGPKEDRLAYVAKELIDVFTKRYKVEQ